MLDDGNTLYRREKYDDASHRYQYAVRRVPEIFTGMEETKETFHQLKVHLLLNLSRCRRKQGHLLEAVSKATEVLTLKPDCLDALHARARAHRESGNFRDAVQDLNEALKLSPQNRDLYRLILKVKEEMSNKELALIALETEKIEAEKRRVKADAEAYEIKKNSMFRFMKKQAVN